VSAGAAVATRAALKKKHSKHGEVNGDSVRQGSNTRVEAAGIGVEFLASTQSVMITPRQSIGLAGDRAFRATRHLALHHLELCDLPLSLTFDCSSRVL
jgi:hypothetical protein